MQVDLREMRKFGLRQWLFAVKEAALEMSAKTPNAQKNWDKVLGGFEDFFYQNYKARSDYEWIKQQFEWVKAELQEFKDKRKEKEAVIKHVEKLIDTNAVAYQERNHWQEKRVYVSA
jgi:hypothetical protein